MPPIGRQSVGRTSASQHLLFAHNYKLREYAEIGSQAKLRIWCSLECKSSSLFTRKKNCFLIRAHGALSLNNLI